MNDAEQITTGFKALADGIIAAGRRRVVFDAFRDLLREMEAWVERSKPTDTRDFQVNAGRLLGLMQAIETIGCWPLPEYRARYRPRAIDMIRVVMPEASFGE